MDDAISQLHRRSRVAKKNAALDQSASSRDENSNVPRFSIVNSSFLNDALEGSSGHEEGLACRERRLRSVVSDTAVPTLLVLFQSWVPIAQLLA